MLSFAIPAAAVPLARLAYRGPSRCSSTSCDAPANASAVGDPAATAGSSAPRVNAQATFSYSFQLGVQISIRQGGSAGADVSAADAADPSKSAPLESQQRDLAARLGRVIGRLVHRGLRPLLRGRTGLDAQSRDGLRALSQTLRGDLGAAVKDATAADGSFDEAAFAQNAKEALDRFAQGFATVVNAQSGAAEKAAGPNPKVDAPVAPIVDPAGSVAVPREGDPSPGANGVASPGDSPSATPQSFGAAAPGSFPVWGHPRHGWPFRHHGDRIDGAVHRMSDLLARLSSQLQALAGALAPPTVESAGDPSADGSASTPAPKLQLSA